MSDVQISLGCTDIRMSVININGPQLETKQMNFSSKSDKAI